MCYYLRWSKVLLSIYVCSVHLMLSTSILICMLFTLKTRFLTHPFNFSINYNSFLLHKLKVNFSTHDHFEAWSFFLTWENHLEESYILELLHETFFSFRWIASGVPLENKDQKNKVKMKRNIQVWWERSLKEVLARKNWK